MGARGMQELDRRENDGIEVSLLWQEGTKCVYVSVVDRHLQEACTQEVDPAAARDAFLHPYAYCSNGWREVIDCRAEPQLCVVVGDLRFKRGLNQR